MLLLKLEDRNVFIVEASLKVEPVSSVRGDDGKIPHIQVSTAFNKYKKNDDDDDVTPRMLSFQRTLLH